MLAKQYSHRLPADYDLGIIRRRAASRGTLWDDTAGLAFKAFVLREKGRHGADGNLYASIYLWRDAAQTIDFFSGSRFANVIDSFGRPQVELWLPLDARQRGSEAAAQVRWLYRETLPIAPDVVLAELQTSEAERNAQLLQQGHGAVQVSAIDVAHWQLVRLQLSAAEPPQTVRADAYEVLYLARPQLAQLPS